MFMYVILCICQCVRVSVRAYKNIIIAAYPKHRYTHVGNGADADDGGSSCEEKLINKIGVETEREGV